MKPIHVKRDKDGIFFARPYLGTNTITKKPIRPYKRFPEARSEAEAQAMAEEWIKHHAAAARFGVTQQLSELLTRYVDWMEAKKRPANTIKTYRSCIRRYVDPYIGSYDPESLYPSDFDDLYDDLMLTGALRREGGIDASTVVKFHWFLCGAFKWLNTEGLCNYNPMLSVVKPNVYTKEAISYSDSDFAKLQAAFEEELHREATTREAIFRRNAIFAAFLAFWNGTRCGETCAESRNDARMALQFMHVGNNIEEYKGVHRVPHTKGGKKRNVSMFEDVIAALYAHYEWQKTYLTEDQQRDGMTPICTTADGEFMRPSKVSELYSDFRDELKLPENTSFHTLRHTHATWLLAEGVDWRTIQERLGHADGAITIKLYTHAIPGRDREAAQAFGNVAKRLGGVRR